MASAGVDVEVKDDRLGGVEGGVEELLGDVVGGWLATAAPYPDGTSVVTVAAAQEFGTSAIPARAPARTWYDSGGKDELTAIVAAELGNAVDGKAASLEPAGAAIVEGIADTIKRGLSPALSESTIASGATGKKKRDARGIPLLDTSHLIDSLDSEVR